MLSKHNAVGDGKSDQYWSASEPVLVRSSNHYWSDREPVLVEMPSYIGAHRASIRGVSLSCDGAGLPLALVKIFHSRKVDDSKYGKFISLLGSIRSPMLGKSACFLWGGATSASFPYHVIGRVSDQYRFIPPIRIALFYGGVLVWG